MLTAGRRPEFWLRAWRVLAVLALLFCAVSAARAQSCTVSAQPMAFGTYDPIAAHASAPLDSTGQLQVDCQGFGGFIPFEAELSAGNAGSYLPRRMQAGVDPLDYNLYLDAAHTRIFGNGVGGTETVSCITGLSSGSCVGSNPPGPVRRATIVIYGRIPAGQDPAQGLYSDAIVVTVTF